MTRPYLFSFWSSPGPAPAYIALCRETIRHNLSGAFDIVELDFDSCAEWVPERDLLWAFSQPATEGRSYSQDGRRMALFTGMLRVALLARHGGLWVDADQIAFDNFTHLAPLVARHDLVAPETPAGLVSNFVLGACAGSGFAQTLWQDLLERIERKQQDGQTTAHWGEYGFNMLNHSWQAHPPDRPWVAPFGALMSFDTETPPALFEPGAAPQAVLSPLAIGFAIFNNGIGRAPRDMEAGALRDGTSLFSQIYAHAMGRSDALDGWLLLRTPEQLAAVNRAAVTSEILARQHRQAGNLARQKQKLQARNDKIAALKHRVETLRARLDGKN